jgi:hypothetical protein
MLKTKVPMKRVSHFFAPNLVKALVDETISSLFAHPQPDKPRKSSRCEEALIIQEREKS